MPHPRNSVSRRLIPPRPPPPSQTPWPPAAARREDEELGGHVGDGAEGRAPALVTRPMGQPEVRQHAVRWTKGRTMTPPTDPGGGGCHGVTDKLRGGGGGARVTAAHRPHIA